MKTRRIEVIKSIYEFQTANQINFVKVEMSGVLLLQRLS